MSQLRADLPAGAPVRVVFRAEGGLPSGTTRATVYAGAAEVGWALVYVAHFDSVLVARQPIGRGEAVTAESVETAWLETTRFRGEPARPGALAHPVTARRTLRAGDALRAGDLVRPPDVETGDRVRVRFERAGVVIALDAHAREPAAVGEMLRVYARDTRTTYRVRLVAPGEADWIETL